MRFSENPPAGRPWWRPTWYELLPELVLVAGLTMFLVDEPDAATSAIESARAVGLMGAAAVGWIVGRVVLARFLPWRVARTTGRSAPFTGIDHRASGTVSIYRTPEGRHVVGLEAFDIQPEPDDDVYVVPGTDRDGGARLDDLRGNQGTQYDDVPADVDVAHGEWTVLIWCQTFGVPVANATPV